MAQVSTDGAIILKRKRLTMFCQTCRYEIQHCKCDSASMSGHRSPNTEATKPNYQSMSVDEVIGELQRIIPCEFPELSFLHGDLDHIKQGIFIELPETRCELLCRVGRVINNYHDKHFPTDDYWNQVRDIMNECFEPYRSKP